MYFYCFKSLLNTLKFFKSKVKVIKTWVEYIYTGYFFFADFQFFFSFAHAAIDFGFVFHLTPDSKSFY